MKATTTRGFAQLGALAMGFAAAVLAFAICMPATANAYTTSNLPGGIVVYNLTSADKDVQLNQHDKSNNTVYLNVKGKPSVKGDIHAYEVQVFGQPGSNTLTVKGNIEANTEVIIGQESKPYDSLTVNVNSTSSTKAGAIVAEDVFAIYATINATGRNVGVSCDSLYTYGSKVNGTSKYTAQPLWSSDGIAAGIWSKKDIYIDLDSYVTGTGYHIGVYGEKGYIMSGCTLKGKATKKTKATSTKLVRGLYLAECYPEGGTVKGYAYAPVASLSKTNPYSVAVGFDYMGTDGGKVYAYNSGKYAWGVAADKIANYDDDDVFTLNAYAKNYGIGLFAFGKTELCNTNATIYGGKYAVYGKHNWSIQDSTIKAYGKNTKGSRTGHGIYLNEGKMMIERSNVTVYAKNSSSYYGICSAGNSDVAPSLEAAFSSTIKVYGYKSKAFCEKNDSAISKGKVGYSCKLYINGTKQTKYPEGKDNSSQVG